MKKIFISILIFSLSFSVVGQNNPENAIILLDGGRTDVQFSFYSQLLSKNGQSIGYKSPNSWDVWENPASLISFNESYLSFGLKPGFNIDPGNYYDIENTIETELDAAIAEYRTEDSQINYPELGTSVGQNGGLFGFNFVYPLQKNGNRSTLSFELSQPLFLNISAINDGFSTMIETQKEVGGQNKIIHMRLNTLLQADLQLRATHYNVGFAKQLGEKIGFGLKVGQTQIQTFLKGMANVNGIMETAGTEYAFNDPYDPRIEFEAGETNKLDQFISWDFKGISWNINLGGLFRITKFFTAGIDFTSNTSANLKGKMEFVQHKVPALNADALLNDDPDAELVEPTKLNLAKLTLTERIENPTSEQLELNFPSSLGFQFSYQGSFLESTISFRKYSGQFGYNFLEEKRYLQLAYGLNLDLSLGIFQLSVGGMKGDLFHEKNAELQDSSALWIPHASIEFAFFLLKNYHLSSKLFASPTPGLGVKLGYFF